MNILHFAGPVRPEESGLDTADGLLLDFIPFRPKSVSEADAKAVKRKVPSSVHRWGFFDLPSMNQLLFLLDEDLINGAVIAKISEKDLRRVAETTGKPLYLDGTCKAKEDILKEQRLPIAGHYFQTLPETEVLDALTKPFILSVNDIDKIEDILLAAKDHPLFALRWETISALQKMRNITETTKEMR